MGPVPVRSDEKDAMGGEDVVDPKLLSCSIMYEWRGESAPRALTWWMCDMNVGVRCAMPSRGG